MALYRGDYRLAHMSQVTGRDEKAAEIGRHLGGKARAYMLTDEQLKERRDTGKGGLPYRYLVYSPQSAALSWTAFYTRDDLQAFLRAYGCKLSSEPKPGEVFDVLFPTDTADFLPLVSESRIRAQTYNEPNRMWLEVDAPDEDSAYKQILTWIGDTVRKTGIVWQADSSLPVSLGENLYRVEVRAIG